jgi:hypothetical protein
MSDEKPPQTGSETREERLAAKLRENLKRRKAQARELNAPDRGLSKPGEPR